MNRDTLDFGRLLDREAVAESPEDLWALIGIYEQGFHGTDKFAEAKTRAASLHLLLGARYASSNSLRRQHYRNAARSAEDALLMDPDFRSARAEGESMSASAAHLAVDDYEALFLWSTAVFYHFRDVASIPERILFNNRLRQAAEVIRVMMDKQPEWYGGSLQFSLGIYYLSVPEAIGGDRGKVRQLMDQAVSMSQYRLLTRWGRAKYFATAEGDKQLYIKDLNWVVTQDLDKMQGPPIWNRYFREDAMDLLETVDAHF